VSETWWAEAACIGMDVNIFHPVYSGSARAAKAVCADCPVRMDCLKWALDHSIQDGIWGGLSIDERRSWNRTHNYREMKRTGFNSIAKDWDKFESARVAMGFLDG
jgi:WhiB family transcriptional regulator, redox-sensing transcriptional regulator